MIIGIDAGTSVVKAVAFSNDGENLAVEARRTKVYSPRPDQSEQDFEEVAVAVGREPRRDRPHRAGRRPLALRRAGLYGTARHLVARRPSELGRRGVDVLW